jgi:type IV pilus assembly protein PilX
MHALQHRPSVNGPIGRQCQQRESFLLNSLLSSSFVGRPKQSQRGVALFISLVMLLLLTILGVSSVQTTSMQERMARNARDGNLAFQAAETAVHDGEQFIEDTFNSLAAFDDPSAAGAGLYYEAAFDAMPQWLDVDWGGGNVKDAATAVGGVASQPRFIIEHIKTVISDQDRLNLDNIGSDTGAGRAQIFRITTRGTGGTDTARVMIQATYGKKF